jgi:hypothetical protein
MKKQIYDIEERLLEYWVRIIEIVEQIPNIAEGKHVLKWLKRNRSNHSGFDIGYLKTNEIKLRSEATSLFDVQRWTFDVRCSVCPMFIA